MVYTLQPKLIRLNIPLFTLDKSYKSEQENCTSEKVVLHECNLMKRFSSLRVPFP